MTYNSRDSWYIWSDALPSPYSHSYLMWNILWRPRFQSPSLPHLSERLCLRARPPVMLPRLQHCALPTAHSHVCALLPGHVVGGRALLSDWDHLVVKGRRSQIKGSRFYHGFFSIICKFWWNALSSLKTQVEKIKAREVHHVGRSHLAGVAGLTTHHRKEGRPALTSVPSPLSESTRRWAVRASLL